MARPDAPPRGPVAPEQLSLEQQLGQLLMVAIPDAELGRETAEFLRRYHVGGVALFYQNARRPWQVARLCADLQRVARENGDPPLLIAIDQEGGSVARLPYPASDVPSAMAIGATRRPEYAQCVAEVLAAEVAALGITMNLAPVADVNTEPRNPVIGIRAYGDRPEVVAAMVQASVVGHHAQGVLCTAKHFPGHGATDLDSHLAAPVAALDWPRLESVELAPFRAAITAGVDGLCTAHVAYPIIDSQPATSGFPSGRPATFSPLLLDDLLRRRLGFQGLVVSDALEMDAIAARYRSAEAAVLAIAAGVDVALLVGRQVEQAEAHQALLQAARSGSLPAARLAVACGRVLAAKGRSAPPSTGGLGLWPRQEHRERVRRVARASITLVRARPALVPLRLARGQRLGLVEFISAKASPVEAAGRPPSSVSLLDVLVRAHHTRTSSALVRADAPPSEAELQAFADAADVLLLATRDAWFEPAQAAMVRRLLHAGRPAVVVALRSPYDLAVLGDAQTYLCTYGDPPCSLEALVDALFGAFDPPGRLPVELPGLMREVETPLTPRSTALVS